MTHRSFVRFATILATPVLLAVAACGGSDDVSFGEESTGGSSGSSGSSSGAAGSGAASSGGSSAAGGDAGSGSGGEGASGGSAGTGGEAASGGTGAAATGGTSSGGTSTGGSSTGGTSSGGSSTGGTSSGGSSTGGTSTGGSSSGGTSAAGSGGDEAGGTSSGGSSGAGSGGTSQGGTSAGGSAGNPGAGGAAGSSGGGAGAGGAGGTAGGGTGGTGGTGTGGTGGCTVVNWCFDGDEDEYGDPDGMQASCNKPGDGWIADGSKPNACDDCRDDLKSVFPSQQQCFTSGYLIGSGASATSFDYDCSGSETECGQFMHATGDCALHGTGQNAYCSGTGYLPTIRIGGVGIDPWCGATQWRDCAVDNTNPVLKCKATLSTKSAIPCK